MCNFGQGSFTPQAWRTCSSGKWYLQPCTRHPIQPRGIPLAMRYPQAALTCEHWADIAPRSPSTGHSQMVAAVGYVHTDAPSGLRPDGSHAPEFSTSQQSSIPTDHVIFTRAGSSRYSNFHACILEQFAGWGCLACYGAGVARPGYHSLAA